MQRILSFVFLTTIIAACGGPAETNLDKLEAKRDSLVKAKATIAEQITSLETQIIALDTNAGDQLASVETMTLALKPFEHFFTVQGVVETDKNAQIYPEMGGRIVSINVKEGDVVSAGQTLMKLDTKVMDQTIGELKTRLELAKTVYEKQDKLWKQNIGSEIAYLEAKNNFQALEKSIASAEAQRAMAVVKAPFAGIVDELMPKEGEMAAPQMPVARLVNLSKMYIKSDVSESYLGKVKAGDSVRIKLPSINESMVSTVTRTGNYINPNNRSFVVRFDVNNPSGKLKPNMLAEVSIRDFHKASAVVIPSTMVQQTPAGDEFVYMIEDVDGQHIAKKQLIKSGVEYKDMIMIDSGLAGNERLVTKGARSIKEGQVVNILN